MKMFVLLLLSLCIFGCSATSDTSTNQTQATINTDSLIDKSFESYEPLSLYGDVWLLSQFNEIGIETPTMINVFIGDSKNEIGFIYENISTPSSEEENLKKDQFGNPYLYYGYLSKVADNVYSSKGHFSDSLGDFNNTVSDEIDFYLIHSDEKYYFCFEVLSTEELINYSNTSFASFCNLYNDIEGYYSAKPETSELQSKIQEKYLFYPTDICINFDNLSVRWVSDAGIGIDFEVFTDDDQNKFVELERSIYQGKLTKLSENIYSSKGEFLPSMLTDSQPISDSVDFYLIIQDHKALIVLEEMTLDELKEYTSNSYYVFSSQKNC